MKPSPDTIYLSIAGFNIKINFKEAENQYLRNKLFFDITTAYKKFIKYGLPKKIDYSISFEERKTIDILLKKKIRNKRFINIMEKIKKKEIVTFYHIGIPQFDMIIRDIVQHLLSVNNGFILHGSASNVHKKAFIFLGSSGAGKSTVISLINKKFPALADDTVIIKKENDHFYFYQTPFVEKESWIKKQPEKYNIGSLFFLHKANSIKIKKIDNKELIIKRLLSQLIAGYGEREIQIKYLLNFVVSLNLFYYLYFIKDNNLLVKIFSKIKKLDINNIVEGLDNMDYNRGYSSQ